MFLKGFTEWHRSFGGMGNHRFFLLSEEGNLSSHLLVAIAQLGRAFPCEGNGWGFKSPWRSNMSYQSRKIKKSKLNKLRFSIGLIWVKLFNKIKKIRRKEKTMQFPGAKKVMEFLKMRNKTIRPNNLRINEWVGGYLNRCLINGGPVNILTPWSLSKALEKRFAKQGNIFIPTKKEMRLLREEMPEIVKMFEKYGFKLNWWVTLARSYLDSRLIGRELEDRYKKMITDLAKRFALSDSVLFLDWEDDVLGSRSAPCERIVKDFDKYIRRGAFEIELQRWRNWAKEEAELNQTNEELERDTRYQIACEVNEGRFLMSEKSPFNFGDFIIIPLEIPERFDNFTIFAPEIKKRIISVLSCYPWRLG